MSAQKPAKFRKMIETSVRIQTQNAVESESLAFGAKCLIAACLPYRDPKPEQLINGCWIRRNGRYSLWIQGGPLGIPYGSYPRLFAIFLATEATRTQSRYITMGTSFKAFCRLLNIDTSRGKAGAGKRLIEQIDRFLEARIGFINQKDTSIHKERMELSDQHSFFWENDKDKKFKEATIVLSEAFYQEITQHHIPIDLRAVVALKQSAMALDIYQWLAYRMHHLQMAGQKGAHPSWEQLNQQFGGSYLSLKHFKAHFIEKLREVKTVYPEAKFSPSENGLLLMRSPTPVPVRTLAIVKK